jgi:hypothetical protein
MANRVNPKYTSCLLSCGCLYSYGIAPPNCGDEVMCPKHGPAIVERGAEFRVSCENCRLSRGFGMARYNAIRLADSHRKATGHAVNVTRAGTRRPAPGLARPAVTAHRRR